MSENPMSQDPGWGEPIAEGDLLPVAAVLVRRPSRSQWASESWSVAGVVAGEVAATLDTTPRAIHSDGEETRYLCGGLTLQLHRDEGASYHHNLTTEAPSVFVICRESDHSSAPQPFLTTVSYDEAAAYLEGGDEVYPVPMPPEVYRWVESYVLAHYVPTPIVKRKRDDWRDPEATS